MKEAKAKPSLHFDFFFLLYLVQQVSRLGERYGNTGGHVAAGSVTVGETGHGTFSFQRGETQLNRFTQQQYSLGQRVPEEEMQGKDVNTASVRDARLIHSRQTLAFQDGTGFPSLTPEYAGPLASVRPLPIETELRHPHPAASAQWPSGPKPTIDSMDLSLVERRRQVCSFTGGLVSLSKVK